MREIAVAVNENMVTMTSLEVVDLINNFRREEANETLKKHDVFLRDIRNEIEVLKNIGLEGLNNFAESYYINSQNKKQPCYKLTKKAIMQMLNKESALVRYKTQEYIDVLEKKTEKVKSLSPMEQLKLQYQVLEDHEQRFEKIEERLDSLEINPHQKRAIQRAKSKRVTGLLGGRKSTAYKDASLRSKVYADMGRQYNNYFDISEYAYTPRNRFKEALELISTYNLTVELSMEVKQKNNQLAFA